jgi:hypothetical protein
MSDRDPRVFLAPSAAPGEGRSGVARAMASAA